MANIKYYDVILKPVVTEKSMAAMAEKKYTFLVHPEANKSMIKEAVLPTTIPRLLFFPSKFIVFTLATFVPSNIFSTAKTKKAIVTLTADSKDIEIFAGL